ncbi:MAG: DUF1501 domain-containing protein [Armatimonadota bacterium]
MEYCCDGYRMLSRRSLLAGALGLAAGSALSQISLRQRSDPDAPVLVVLFLRGGCDGLNTVVPFGEDEYHRLRPSLALRKRDVLDLDGFFGLHPSLAPLLRHFREGRLAVVHAVGSQDRTRSHFEAMSAMERGVAAASEHASSGWVARYLNERATGPSPLRSIAFSNVLPDSMRGGTSGIALENLKQYRLRGDGAQARRLRRSLTALYSSGGDVLTQAGRATLEALDLVENLPAAPSASEPYPESDLGLAFAQTAQLIHAGVGLEVACLEKGGWDTHVAQGATTGWHALLLDDLARSLSAFAADVAEHLSRVTVVVMTEFGRRAYENAGLGTDHGRASVMFLLGEGVVGGKVHGDWPGLAPERLEEPGDLRVTTDYRSVLAEVLRRRMALQKVDGVLPGVSGEGIGTVA